MKLETRNGEIIRAEFGMESTCKDIYNSIVEKITEQIKEDVINETKDNLMGNKKFMQDIEKMLKNKIMDEMKPNKELTRIAESIEKMPQANEYGNLNVRIFEK